MKVLFLDDEAWRHTGMDLMLDEAQHELHHAYSTAWFSHALDTKSPFDLVCFDHDLGGPTTGLNAAEEFIAAKHRPTLCLVHSWNPHGAMAIARILRKAGHTVIVAPFSTALKALFDTL